MPEGQSTTVVSSPITDDSAPWLWYTRFTLGYEEMVTDVVDVPGLSSYREVIDAKAMRVLRPDREVQLVFEQASVLSANNVNVVANFRGLFAS